MEPCRRVSRFNNVRSQWWVARSMGSVVRWGASQEVQVKRCKHALCVTQLPAASVGACQDALAGSVVVIHSTPAVQRPAMRRFATIHTTP
jgi:hypothetical protein